MNYNVLFYSNNCDYCNTILKQLKQNNIQDNDLIRICVDNNRNIPKYINKVPTIISKTHKQPIIDEGVYMWINTLIQNGSNMQQRSNMQQHANMQQPSNMQQQQQPSDMQQSNESINPYSPIEMASTYSDSFSYLDNSNDTITHNFAYLNNSNNSNMSNQSNASQQQKPEQEDEYTKLMNARDNDPEILQPMRRI